MKQHDIEQNPTVFVIDDDEAVRDSLKVLMQSVGQQVKTFNSPEYFLEHFSETISGCIILDIRMPGMSGLELQNKLNNMHCTLPVIFITGHGDVPMAVKAIKNGAMGFLQKPFRDQELIDLVYKAIKLNNHQRKTTIQHKDILNRLSTLTEREKEILTHIINGKANKIIATKINLSQRTVEIHRARVMEKMGTKSLAQLIQKVLAIKKYNKEEIIY